MTALTIPEFETERLCLRAPRMEDTEPFAAFLASPRAEFLGGPHDFRAGARAFGHMAGLWWLRGYSLHIWTLKDGTPVGHGGLWFPRVWPEPEFGWALWDRAHEGKGYVTEAMRRLMAWAWDDLGFRTAVAYITPGNAASVRIAERLGGWRDAEAKAPDDAPTLVYRFAPGGRA